MSELCFSTIFNTKICSFLISVFTLFCSSVLSHPLYFLYFIFFFPYIFRVLSFLSPLFITTSLLLLPLLSFSPAIFRDNFSADKRKVCFLSSGFHSVLKKLQPEMDTEAADFHSLEALEVYKMVFDTTIIAENENPDEDPEEKVLQAVESSILRTSNHDNQEFSLNPDEGFARNFTEGSVDYDQTETVKSVIQEKRFEDFLKEIIEFESVDGSVELKTIGTELDKRKTESSEVNRSEAETGNKLNHSTDENGVENKRELKKYLQNQRGKKTQIEDTENGGELKSKNELGYDLGTYGSNRKEKEWKRTLACKIFEERHNSVDGSEGMDLLWETYEAESTKSSAKSAIKRNDNLRGKIRYYEEEEEDEDDDEEEGIDAQLCCLQAFKFSAGKMNLGVGRRNFARISKAVKGIGWLHRVSKNGKKVQKGDTFQFA